MWTSTIVDIGPSGPECGVDHASRAFASHVESINGGLRDQMRRVD